MKMKSKIGAMFLLFLLVLPSGCALFSDPPPKPEPVTVELPRPRFIVVLRDISGSYKAMEQTLNSIKEIVGNLGPRDSFLLIDISSTFTPEQNVKIQVSMAQVPQEIFTAPDKIIQWRNQQASLDTIWHEVESKQTEILNYLHTMVESSANKTDLYTALEYVALRLSHEPTSEKRVYCYSDLMYEAQRIKTDLPPHKKLSFKDTQIAAYFVPFEQDRKWQAKEKAWRDWFVNHCEATSFVMFDPMQSMQQNPLPPSQVPKKLKSPFGE